MKLRQLTWAERLEWMTLAIAVLAIGSLVTWWTIFARRMIHDYTRLNENLLQLTINDQPELLTKELAQAEQHGSRLLLMIAGESGVFVIALAASIVGLFMLARRRREAKAAMERMLQFTTHELKTPIAGVRALLQSLALGSLPPPAQAQLIQAGVGEMDRLEHLAETILAFQRAVVRGEATKTERLRGDELLQEVLTHRAKTNTAEALAVSAPPAPISVWADRDAFRVVVENLLDNARKYGGGKVELSTEADATKWRLKVRDFGQGFEPQVAERLFDPFARQRGGSVQHGSGLGLTLSRQLARQMGGELSAQSEGPGKGATFTFELKVAEAPRA